MKQKYEYQFAHLNLGNNFTNKHLFESIARDDNFDEFYETISGLPANNDTEITILATANFNHAIVETFNLFELCELLECFYDRDLATNNF